MKSRIARLGVVAAGLLALVGGITPPAHADTILVAAFTGTATVASGLSYPCVGPGTTPNMALCPTAPSVSTLPLNGTVTGSIPNPHLVFTHGGQAVAVASTVCVPIGININKPGKPVTHAGLCGFAGGGTVTGHCGLSGGQVTVNFTDALGQDFTLNIHFTGLGGFLVITGHATKVGDPSNHGLVIGLTVAVPPTPTTGQSCLSQTARDFTIAGVAAAVPEPLL